MIFPEQKRCNFADSGLLVSLLDEEAGDDLRANRNLGVYKGALYENVVGEALVKSGYKLFYYKREDSTLEEEKYTDIRFGFKLSHNNVGYSDGIYTFPYFCAFLLKRYMATFSHDGIG